MLDVRSGAVVGAGEFPDRQRSLLEAPELHFVRSDNEPPWDVRARRGRVIYIETEEGEKEVVILEEDVVLTRQRPAEDRFLRVETEELTVFPETELAETDRAVMITTEVGTTTGTGLEAYLQAGRVFLGTVPGDRVNTHISEPELLEP